MNMEAPKPFGDGETYGAYRRRVLDELKKYSDSYKSVNLETIRDAGAFKAAEHTILKDSMVYVSNPANLAPAGHIGFFPRRREDPNTGARITEFYASPSAVNKTIFGEMKPALQRVVKWHDSTASARN
jgi:hypothetical protein